ncbi:MAG: hypothetical protein A3F72_15275 [Bacteroidetes bacterium RIFCSPLOWO2_12_FULL_35_15]|nr:MAG: hypothetical protein A3F72_15275 [Bacteroidetes bacterium RIFCSPLOWO2_12_FULL_35_15]
MMNTILNRKLLFNIPSGLDPLTKLFLSATGITNSAQIIAIDYLCVNLRKNGLLSKIKALHPFVGGDATKHSFNIMDTSKFQLTFINSPTQDGNGVTFNGTSQYANTGFNPFIEYGSGPLNLEIYSRTNNALSQVDIGSYSTSSVQSRVFLKNAANSLYYVHNGGNVTVGISDSLGLFSCNSDSNQIVYKNGISIGTSGSGSGNTSNFNYYIGALNNNNVASFYSNRNYALSAFCTPLNASETLIFYNIVQQYQTLLNRQV